MNQEGKKPNRNQKEMIRKRGKDPKNYVVLKQLNFTMKIKDIRDGTISYINKIS